MRIAVTGASGLVGTALVPALQADGHDVVRLVRRPARGDDELTWDPAQGTLASDAFVTVDAVVHLAGAGVADKRWTAGYRDTIRRSRVDGTSLVARGLADAHRLDPGRARVLLSASAVGYYGDTGDTVRDESGPPGTGFLADTCAAWEGATAAADGAARVVHLRTGIVLARHGGALAKQLPIFRACLGAPLGSGRQWLPWISLADEIGAIRHCLTTDLRGPVNLVAPEPVTNRDFTRALGRALHRPTLPVPVPGPLLTLGLGGFAREGVLAGQRLVPAALQRSGYRFAHPTLPDALTAVLA